MGARLVDKGVLQELGNPIGAACHPVNFLGVAAGHHQQIPHAAGLQVFAGVLRHLVGEQVHQLILQGEDALLHGKANGGRGQALAERKEDVGRLGVVGGPVALGVDLAVAQEHQPVHLHALAVEFVQQVQHSLGGHSHAFWGDVLQFHGKNFLPKENAKV